MTTSHIRTRQVTVGPHLDAYIIFECDHKLFCVSVLPSPGPEDNMLNSAVEEIGRLVHTRIAEDFATIVHEFYLKYILPDGTVNALSMIPRRVFGMNVDVHSFLYPPMVHLRLEDHRKRPRLVPSPPFCIRLRAGRIPPPAPLPNVELWTGTRSSRELVLLDLLCSTNTAVVSTTLVDQSMALCSADTMGLRSPGLRRELLAFQAIHTAYFSHPDLRGRGVCVPRFIGYVQHEGTGQVVGFTREWIFGDRLDRIDLDTVPEIIRLKWAVQIHMTVQKLHEINVTWTHGRPGNVIIIDDRSRDPYLVGFGGKWIREEVDQDLSGAEEGLFAVGSEGDDFRAVREIAKFLDVLEAYEY